MDLESAPDASVTRFLLRCGVVAGPFYLAVSLIQARLRSGFDLARHPLSVLANGPGGWVQTGNFAVTGLLVIAAAVGFQRALGRSSRGVTLFLTAYGAAILAAAVFPADPVDGFPPGTPTGPPASISTTGLVHFAAGALGFTCLGVGCLFGARTMARRHAPSLAVLSLVSGLAVLVGFFGGMMAGPGIVGIWLAVVVGWAWLAVMSLRIGGAAVRRGAIASVALLLGIASSARAQTDAAKPAPELKRLDYFVGTWAAEGEFKPGPLGAGGKFTGTNRVAWMDGGFFLVTQSEFSGAMGKGTETAYMGWDGDERIYTYDSFNSMGEADHAKGSLDGDTWTWRSETRIGAQTMKGRLTLKMRSASAYDFRFEMSSDGKTWTTVLEGKDTKK